MTTATFTTTFRGSIVDLATIARWYVNQGLLPRSRNELVNCAVSNFAKWITENSNDAITNEADAFEFLNQLGLIGKNLKHMQPGLSKALHNLSPLTKPTESLETILTEKAQVQSRQNLADQAAELMKKQAEREQRDANAAKQMLNVQNLPLAEDEE